MFKLFVYVAFCGKCVCINGLHVFAFQFFLSLEYFVSHTVEVTHTVLGVVAMFY